MDDKKEYMEKDTSIVAISKDDALYREQKFSGITYDQIFPVSCIYDSKDVDNINERSNFKTDYAKDKHKRREDMLLKMDRYVETQYQYTE